MHCLAIDKDGQGEECFRYLLGGLDRDGAGGLPGIALFDDKALKHVPRDEHCSSVVLAVRYRYRDGDLSSQEKRGRERKKKSCGRHRKLSKVARCLEFVLR